MNLCSIIAPFLLITLAQTTSQAAFVFQKVADSHTPIPGGRGTFSSFSPSEPEGSASSNTPFHPSISGEVVAFWGRGENGEGIYKHVEGTLSRVVDTQEPGAALGSFSTLSEPSLSRNNVAFSTVHEGFVSIFAEIQGTVVEITSQRIVPQPWSKPSIDETTVVYAALSESSSGDGSGVYVYEDGEIFEAKRTGDPTLPTTGSCTFLEFDGPSKKNGFLAFRYTSRCDDRPPTSGIYLDGNLIATTETAVPGHDRSFSSFGTPSQNNGFLAFYAHADESLSGIYLYEHEELLTVADSHTFVPNSEESFASFDAPSTSESKVAFSTGSGIYLYSNRALVKVLDTSDLLDGKAIQSLHLGQEGFSSPSLVFRVTFVDRSEAIYRAEIYSSRFYNDLSWGPGQRTENITRYTTASGSSILPDGSSGHLVEHRTGEESSILLTVTGGHWESETDSIQGEISDLNTEAHRFFNGAVDTQGVVAHATEDLVLEFNQLDPHLHYNIVLFGNGGLAQRTNGFAATTLLEAEEFINRSTLGALFSGPEDSSTLIRTGFNTQLGHVARFEK